MITETSGVRMKNFNGPPHLLNGAHQHLEHDGPIKQIVNVLNLRSLQSYGVSGFSRLVSARPDSNSALLCDGSEYLKAAEVLLLTEADVIGRCATT